MNNVLTDLFFLFIPVANGAANVCLKMSVDRRRPGRWKPFLAFQALGYAIFGVVATCTYLLLFEYPANVLVVIFSSNYLVTRWMSRWLLGNSMTRRDIWLDISIIIGVVIFMAGQE